jgi:hypothetical protein
MYVCEERKRGLKGERVQEAKKREAGVWKTKAER